MVAIADYFLRNFANEYMRKNVKIIITLDYSIGRV